MSQSYKWIPVIDEDVCTGCALCVEACGPQSLGIVDGLAMLLRADTCGSEEHCISVCPDDAIHMQWIPLRGDVDIGDWMTSAPNPELQGRRMQPMDDI
jgi:MinD superfamily P-loop ATPase